MNIDTVILDKTGTITEGKPEVTDVILLNGFSQEEARRIAVRSRSPSEHPLSEAIVHGRHIEGAASERRSQAVRRTRYPRRRRDTACLAGNTAMMEEHGMPTPLAAPGKYTVGRR